MNKKQYNNIINHSLQYDCKDSENPLDTVRVIFNNMGVALPQGTIKEVYDTVSTGEYMGWKKCTLEEAKEAANNGIAAMGISENKIVVLSAEDDEQPVQQTASVLTLTDNTPAVAVANLQYYSYSYGSTTGGSTTIYPPYTQENAFLDKPYNPNYPYTNIRTEQQYYTTLDSYSAELRNEFIFKFTFAEVNSLSMYMNNAIYKNSTQQEKEQVIEDAISIAQTAISIGVNFVPVVGQYLSNFLTGIDVLAMVAGLNQSTAEENIKDVISCINSFSHNVGDNTSSPKPNNITYTISLLKKSPNYGREIKIESSDGLKDIYTLENAAYDMLLTTAIANAHKCTAYKIAPQYTYYWEDLNN